MIRSFAESYMEHRPDRMQNLTKKKNRFEISDVSESGHCCFGYTVMDTKTENQLCECFKLESAEKICAALNFVESQKDET